MAGREKRFTLAIGQKVLVAGATLRLIRSHANGSVLIGISSEGPVKIEKGPRVHRPPGTRITRNPRREKPGIRTIR